METFGRYQLIKKLATGGMGQVFLARQKGPVGFEKLVVVKRILPHLSEEEEFIHMFFDEARIAALLNHPNIAQIYDLGEVDGTYYIAMEYVYGDSLRAVNQRANELKGGFPLGLKCRVIADAAAGLDFAHRAKSPSGQALGLIHRDVSPQNILVGLNGAVKLIDFGVAKAAGKISTTTTGAIKGKYAYMSPEQARGEELDHRSDVFGLGIVFYEALISNRLFKRDSETATLRAVVGTKVPPPSTVVKGIPKQLDGIVLKALAKKRPERFQSASELQLAIEDFLVRQRLAGTSAHLSAFMRELYPEQSSGDPSPSSAVGGSDPTQLSTQKTPSKARPEPTSATTPVRKSRLSFEEIMKERIEAEAKAAPAPQPAERPPPSPARRPELNPDPADLEQRLARTGPSDSVRGMFFNAVLNGVNRFAGPIAEPAVRGAAKEPRNYTDAFAYPTADFLRVLWKATEVIAPMCTGVDQAFFELGAACMDALARSTVGRSLEQFSSDGDAQWLLAPLLASLNPMVSPGERSVESSVSRSACILVKNDPLPPHFHAGLVTHAFARLRNVAAKATCERRAANAFSIKLQW
ncbi:MAG: DUF2378 family protein [Myxococcales bacterium]|nr:DUF2378 family protein [Myxococcales bacterium]